MNPTTHTHPTQFDAIDERLFAAWSNGNEQARADAWLLMHRYLYSLAVSVCGRSAADRTQALQWADEAMTDAWQEVDDRLTAGHAWDGEPLFVGLVRSRVVFHSLRRAERGLRWNRRIRDLQTPEGAGDPIDLVRSEPPHQEQLEMAVATTREHLSVLVARLRWLRELAANRPALKAVLDASLAYLRACCERAVPDAAGQRAPLTELIPRLDRDGFEASESEMNQFIMSRLNIGRNVLDLRRRQIRQLAEG